MEEQTHPQPAPTQPITTSPVPKKQNNKSLVVIAAIVFLLMTGGLVYLGYQNYQLQQRFIQLLEQRAVQNQAAPSPTASPPSPVPKDSQDQSVSVRLSANEYNQGEPITITIKNSAQQNIYYFPETCASNLVQVLIVQDSEFAQIQGDPKICTLAPSVETLLPNGSITSEIPEKTVSKIYGFLSVF